MLGGGLEFLGHDAEAVSWSSLSSIVQDIMVCFSFVLFYVVTKDKWGCSVMEQKEKNLTVGELAKLLR